MKDNVVYLRHILDCIRRIEEDTAGGYEIFLASPTHQDAVMRNLTKRFQDFTQKRFRVAPGDN